MASSPAWATTTSSPRSTPPSMPSSRPIPDHTGTPMPRGGVMGSVRDMAFRGWPAEALEFYEGLEADNTKTYWTEHKAVYDKAVRAPMEALLAELEADFGE